jgi:hypothetical protein
MIEGLLLFAALFLQGAFIVDATAEVSFTLHARPDAVCARLAEIGLLSRNMPGVVEIRPEGDDGYLYRTEREIPFSGMSRNDFPITRVPAHDGAVLYRTLDPQAQNWMSYRLNPSSGGEGRTRVDVRLRVRLVRDSGTEIHLLAPVLGESFISEQMEKDLRAMLEEFAGRAVRELEAEVSPVAGKAKPR